MPIKINTGQDDFWIYPTTEIKEIDLGSFDLNSFKIRQDLFLIDIKKRHKIKYFTFFFLILHF